MAKAQAVRSYNFTLTENIQFKVPAEKLNFKNYDWWHLLYRFSNLLALLLSALLLLTTLWNTFSLSSSAAASANSYIWSTILVGLGLILIWQLSMVGLRRLVDPPGFIGVLSFALISILVWLISPEVVSLDSTRTFNTFGVAFTKEIAGLGVISLVGVYYFLNLFLDKKHKLEKALATIYLFLAASAITLLVAGTNFNELAILVINAIFALVSWAAAFYYRPQLKRFGKLSFLTLFLVSSSFFLVVDHVDVWKILLALILACLAWFWCSLFVENFQISLGFGEWRNQVRKILNRQEAIDSLFSFPTLNLLFLIGWLTLLLFMWSLVYQPDFSSEFNNLFAYLGQLQATLSASTQSLFLGLSNSASIFPTTFFYKVVTYQGLLGLIAYLGLAFTVIYVTIRQIIRDRRRELPFSIAEVFAPATIFIPIIGLLVNLNTTVVLLWWVLFGVVTASGYLPKRVKLKILNTNKYKGNWKRVIPVARLLLALLLVYVWIVVNNNLLTLLNDGII